MAKGPKRKGMKTVRQTKSALGAQNAVPTNVSELSKGLRSMRSSKTPRVKGGM